MHPLQQQFLEHAALQCGFCTPGLLVAAKALLDRNPDPTETEIRYALAGNLCRCTGYDKIVRAVQAAAAQMRTEEAAR
jgi:carbon-monoxide dehydrogenase small subunit